MEARVGRQLIWQILAAIACASTARADSAVSAPLEPAPPFEVSASGNFGLGAPAGVFSVMARIDFYRAVFVEADAGYGIAGREVGGGIGVTLMAERAKTAKLGWANARITGSALVTQSRTTDREAGLPGAPLPELVQGAGTYTWGYLMTGGDIKLDSHLYILAEVGIGFRINRDADYPMDPSPDDAVCPTIRAGVGATF